VVSADGSQPAEVREYFDGYGGGFSEGYGENLSWRGSGIEPCAPRGEIKLSSNPEGLYKNWTAVQ